MRPRLLAFALVLVSCDRGAATRGPLHAALGGDTVARVGDLTIASSLVGAVAAAQLTSPRVALDRLIDDALAAQGARAEGVDRRPSVSWAIETADATAVAARVGAAARAAGPPTDEELERVTALHWLDVDLPEQLRVVHSVVLRPKDPAQSDAARALAARIATAVAGAKDADDFRARANAVPHDPSLQVVSEELPPFVEDGRFATQRPSAIDPAFAKGAFALKNPGDTSGLVLSPFGWHVIRLIERLPPKILPAEERRARFANEVIAHRGKIAINAILGARQRGITVLPDAEARMAAATPSGAP